MSQSRLRMVTLPAAGSILTGDGSAVAATEKGKAVYDHQ